MKNNDKFLVPRLLYIMPTKFLDTLIHPISDTAPPNMVDAKTIVGTVVDQNYDWAVEVVNNGNLKLSDVLHDFERIYSGRKSSSSYYIPRISTDSKDKFYVDNSKFMEFLSEITFQLTEEKFTEEMYENRPDGVFKLKEDAQDFFNFKYSEIETMANKIMNVHSDNDDNRIER